MPSRDALCWKLSDFPISSVQSLFRASCALVFALRCRLSLASAVVAIMLVAAHWSLRVRGPVIGSKCRSSCGFVALISFAAETGSPWRGASPRPGGRRHPAQLWRLGYIQSGDGMLRACTELPEVSRHVCWAPNQSSGRRTCVTLRSKAGVEVNLSKCHSLSLKVASAGGCLWSLLGPGRVESSTRHCPRGWSR